MKTIAKREGEFTTRFLKVSKSGQHYVGVQNGGYKGAHQPADRVNGDWKFWHIPLVKVSRSDAEAIADEMGVEL
jgi:hypothetical protein